MGKTNLDTLVLGDGIYVTGPVVSNRNAPVAKTTTTTLTAAEVKGGMISANQGAGADATYTLPDGTSLDAAFSGDEALSVGDCFDMTLTNVSTVAAEDVTVQGGTGTTLNGSGFVASNAATTDKSAGAFRFRKTAANTFQVYRIG